jgi:hypothetical protein
MPGISETFGHRAGECNEKLKGNEDGKQGDLPDWQTQQCTL